MKTYTYFDNILRIELYSGSWQGRHDCECAVNDIIVIPEYKGCFIVNEINGANICVSPFQTHQIEKGEKSGYIGIDETNKFLQSYEKR